MPRHGPIPGDRIPELDGARHRAYQALTDAATYQKDLPTVQRLEREFQAAQREWLDEVEAAIKVREDAYDEYRRGR